MNSSLELREKVLELQQALQLLGATYLLAETTAVLEILIAALLLVEAVGSLNESLPVSTVAVKLCSSICSGCDAILFCIN